MKQYCKHSKYYEVIPCKRLAELDEKRELICKRIIYANRQNDKILESRYIEDLAYIDAERLDAAEFREVQNGSK